MTSTMITDADAALLEACRVRDDAAAQRALAAGADPNVREPGTQQTPLMLAAAGASGSSGAAAPPPASPLLRRLAAAGARVLAAAPDGRTALHAAAGAGDAGAVRALLALNASAVAADGGGATPLHALARCERGRRGGKAWVDDAEEIVSSLLAAGARAAAADRTGRSAMAVACGAGAAAVAYALFDAGARLPSQISGDLAAALMDLIQDDLDESDRLAAAVEEGKARVDLLRTVDPGLTRLFADSAAAARGAERRAAAAGGGGGGARAVCVSL
ncbi:MAG: ankyrin repeat-containing domain protein [Monoraphidium minutum]|nr:MAG: ankyrin repeat-containing domain protein [Monoraphidium minutum]